MESTIHENDIVIAGAGIAGLATALGLHRLGFRTLVLESSDSLRTTGFALTLWTNAWRALDVLGVGDSLREKCLRIRGFKVGSRNSGGSSPGQASDDDVNLEKSESACVRRRDLLEILESELPHGTIKFSSKIVSIEESGCLNLVHLADGSVFRTKVLIGCDGINSMVAKWLGLQDPVSVGRSAIRGFVTYSNGHGFEPRFHTFFGGGVRYGFVPCDEKSLYWFCTFADPSFKYDENNQDPLKMKQFVLSSIGNAPQYAQDVVERTELDFISCAPLKFRVPWNILFGNITKDNVCVVGDALHPMTPDIGQGGCSALEDGIVLARCLGTALPEKRSHDEKEWIGRAKMGLEKYAKERRWRSFSLVSTAYITGLIQETDNKAVSFLRDKFLARYVILTFVRMAGFDFGKLVGS